MADIKWMDFSGAPPILIPERLLPFWNGFYVPDDDPDDPWSADITLPDGRRFVADCDNPDTDYEAICGRSGSSFLHPLGSGQALVIIDHSDGTVGWWPEERMLLTCSRHLPDQSTLDQLQWKLLFQWNIPDSRLLLMNSCLHGADPNKPPKDFDEISLEPGKYSVEEAYS